MKQRRSASQILFGFLPDQTVDVGGGVWRVVRWNDPIIQREVDVAALREELIKVGMKWAETGKDGGFVADLLKNAEVRVKSLDRDRGVWLEAFPRQWKCRNTKCNRIHETLNGKCVCGSTSRGQLPFVGYHDACGRMKEPYIPRCREHDDVAIKLPGTAAADEILFYCPVCSKTLRKGMLGPTCDCPAGGKLQYTVHRAASVFTPRSVVIVNPPTQRRLQQLQSLGGSEAALAWIVAGLQTKLPGQSNGGPDPTTIRQQLKAQGVPENIIESMLSAGGFNQSGAAPAIELPDKVRVEALSQAKTIALALMEHRTTIEDLAGSVSAGSTLHTKYLQAYPPALERAGLERVELVDKFPVLTGQFGYTRGHPEPGRSRLRAYREKSGAYTVYGEVAETEALFVRLAPEKVARWLESVGVELPEWRDAKSASTAILQVVELPKLGDLTSGNEAGRLLLGLVHSMAHRLIKLTAVFSGIERNALSELLVPLHLGFFVYAAARGDFVLGGLQAVFESELDDLLIKLVTDEHRCALDPGCASSGAACGVCLHLGETSCRLFNTHLSREYLAGPLGYLQGSTSSPVRLSSSASQRPKEVI